MNKFTTKLSFTELQYLALLMCRQVLTCKEVFNMSLQYKQVVGKSFYLWGTSYLKFDHIGRCNNDMLIGVIRLLK